MDDVVVHRLLQEGIIIPLGMLITAIIIVAINVIGGTIKGVARERTRRDIAAFIAEGSMTPEQGERLLKAKDGNA